MVKFLSVIISMLVLSGCGLTPQRVDPSQPIQSNNGFVMMSVHCDDPVVFVFIHKPGIKASWSNAIHKVACGDVLIGGDRNVVKFFNLEQGEYNIGSYYADNGRTYNQGLYEFTVEPGVINYIGRVEVGSKVVMRETIVPGETTRVDVVHQQKVDLVDNEENDKNDLIGIYPKVFDKFNYKRKLAIKM